MRTLILFLLTHFIVSELAAQCPGVNAGPDQTITAGSVVELYGTACGVTSVKWITSGDGVFDEPTALVTKYTPGETDIASGKVKLTLKSTNPRGFKDVMKVVIEPCPSVDAGLDKDTICGFDEGTFYELVPFISGIFDSVRWTTSGSGFFDNEYSAQTYYNPSAMDIGLGDVVLTLTVYPANNGCKPVKDSIMLRLNDPARVDLGDFPIEICRDVNSIGITADISGTATTAYWSSSGTGYFSPNPGITTTYFLSESDLLLSPGASLFVSATTDDPPGVCPADGDYLDVYLYGAYVRAMNDFTVCANASGGAFNVTANSNSPPEVQWTTNGTGYFDDEYAQNTVYNYSAMDVGLASVELYFTGYSYDLCNPYRDTVTVWLNEAPWLEFPEQFVYVCASSPYVPAVVYPYGYAFSGAWVSSGTGYFDDPYSFGTTYNASKEDVEAGCVDLTFITDDPDGPCTSISGTMWGCFLDCKMGDDQLPENETRFQLYPNPATVEVTVVADEQLEQSKSFLTDLSGKKLEIQWIGETSRLAVADLPSGIYFLHLVFNGKRVMKKLVKN